MMLSAAQFKNDF